MRAAAGIESGRLGGCLKELERVVAQLRRNWPKTRINIRGDSGFCRESIKKWTFTQVLANLQKHPVWKPSG